MEKPLYIPDSKKWDGLTVYCYKCARNVSDICKETGRPIQRCPFGDRHVFKVYIYEANSKNKRKTKKLESRDLNEAIKEAITFQKEVKQGITNDSNKSKGTKPQTHHIDEPVLLTEALSRYVAWLHNENVPQHRKRERSKEYLKDLETSFEMLVQILTNNKFDLTTFGLEDINDQTVGVVYQYFIEEKNYSARSLNKHFGYYTSFFGWYINEFNTPMRNWFERVERKRINPKPVAITAVEFEAIIQQVKPENGIKHYSHGVKRIRNLFRPWLVSAFKLCLYSGRRREEILNMKFSDIQEINGIQIIKVPDIKVNRIQNRRTNEEKKYNFVPVTAQLKNLLNELGYEENKDSDKFIIADEIKMDRTKIMTDTLSRGFTHFAKQVTDRPLTLKSIRKAYLTELQLFTQGNPKSISGHSNNDVLDKFYIDQTMIAKANQTFEIFPGEEKRKEEIEKVRNDSTNKEQSNSIEK